MKRKLLIVIALIAFTSIGLSSIVHRDNKIEFQKVELQSKQAEIKQLEIDYKTLDKKQNEIQLKSDASKADVEKLQKEKEELLQRQQELEQQVSAKRAADAIAANKLQQAAASVAISAKANAAPLSSNQSKAFIYSNESGNNPSAINGSGCYGLGQDCNGIVRNQCGADYACQDEYFTGYMQRRYGTWEAAKAFWLARVPINGRDVGNWW